MNVTVNSNTMKVSLGSPVARSYISRSPYDAALPVTDVCAQYRILFTSPDGEHYVPSNTSTSTDATSQKSVNTRKFDPFGDILCYTNAEQIDAGDRPVESSIYYQYQLVLGYAFNVNGNEMLIAGKPVYAKAMPQSDGSAILDSVAPIVQALPIAEDGKIYIYLGTACNTTHIELHISHPVYEYKNGAVCLWTNTQVSADALPEVSVADNGKALKVVNGEWSADFDGIYIASYGSSTYVEVLAAYQANKAIYCRASSNSNPATGDRLRMALLASVNNQVTPTEFEFQYYHSVAPHTDVQQGDQVYVYKLNSSGTWSVTVHEAYSRITVSVAGGISKYYDDGTLTLSLLNPPDYLQSSFIINVVPNGDSGWNVHYESSLGGNGFPEDMCEMFERYDGGGGLSGSSPNVSLRKYISVFEDDDMPPINCDCENYELVRKYTTHVYDSEAGMYKITGYLVFQVILSENGVVKLKTATISDMFYEYNYLHGAMVTFSEQTL